ncbi:MAG: protein kinase [Planctomycetota bacterium]
MPISSSEFWSQLLQIGLVSEADGRQLAASLSEKLGVPVSECSPEQCAQHAISAGVLTAYQANVLLRGMPQSLVVGSFLMRDDSPVQPLTHWLPAQTVSRDSGPSKQGFLLRVPLSQLSDSVRDSLAAAVEIDAETLQKVELSGGASSGDQEQTVEIFSPLPKGASLFGVLNARSSLSARKVVRIGTDLAAALQTMHDKQAVHGAVSADHVWVTPKGHAVLLRDPSSPARRPRDDWSSSWIQRLDSPGRHAAPELSAADALPSVRSDLYALGSLLFSILAGREGFPGASIEEYLTSHRETFPEELVQATEQGAGGDPLLRVLAFALAKDPASRFESASQFSQALQRAGETLAASSSGSGIGNANSPPSPRALSPAQSSPAQSSPAQSSPAESSPAQSLPAESLPAESSPAEKDAPDAKGQRSNKKVSKSKARESSRRTGKDSVVADQETIAKKQTATQPSKSAAASIAPIESTSQEKVAAERVAAPDPIAVVSVAPAVSQQPDRSLSMPAAASSPSSAAAESDSSPRRRRRKKKNRLPLLAGMMALPLLMLGLAIALRGRDPVKETRVRPDLSKLDRIPSVGQARTEIPETKPDQSPKPETGNGYELVESDRLLWVPPYPADSQSPSLQLVPPGPAAIATFQLGKYLSDPQTASLRDAFNPELQPLLAKVAKRTGIAADEIARCTVSLFPGKDGWPEVALAVSLRKPVTLREMTKRWDAGASPLPDGAYIYVGDEADADAYFIAGGERGKLKAEDEFTQFAVGSVDRIREVAELDGGAIPLARSLQGLWSEASEESDLAILITPNFLFADAREVLAGSLPELTTPLKQWLIPDVAAMLISADVEDGRTYLELRQSPSGSTKPSALLRTFREVVERWPGWADDFIVRSVPDPAWRLLANRLPMMTRFAGGQMRSTQIGESVVASMYLPNEAAAQLSLATTLALNTPPGDDLVASATPTTESLSVDQMLDRPMSISFLQLSLQFAVDAVSDEFRQSLPEGITPPVMRIIGSDLQLNGITQNQQIRGFDRSDIPLRRVLTELVLGANPDRTAGGPDDPKQSLIWVVHPTGKPPEETEILITTRDAAEGKYDLPEEFRLKP